LRRVVRRLQRDAGLSTVLVTHDAEEAALLADEIVVIADGRLLQAGSREDVYSRPASPRVARLLGVPNLVPATVASATELSTGLVRIAVAGHGLDPGAAVVWGVRSEHVRIGGDGRYRAEVVDVADLGAATAVTVRLADGTDLYARAGGAVQVTVGAPCRVDIDPASILVWADSAAADQPLIAATEG
jgi:ABC-type Fe3+/spermidine/putrescine transport system ATPase subunit